jgi:hypothetical protein
MLLNRVHDALEHWGLINYAVNPEMMTLETVMTNELPAILKPHQEVLQLERDEFTTRRVRAQTKRTTTSSLTTQPDIFPLPTSSFTQVKSIKQNKMNQ